MRKITDFILSIKSLLLIVIFSLLIAPKVYAQALFLPWPGSENNWIVPGMIVPLRRAPQFPDMTANFNYSFNNNGTIDLNAVLNDPNPSEYSVLLGNYQGSDPGPDPDFYSATFTLFNVQPGVKYLNVKKKINGDWSTVSYWTLNIPYWVQPTQVPIQPTDVPPSFLNSDQFSTIRNYLLFGALVVVATTLVMKKFRL